jgi:hypothetical protein
MKASNYGHLDAARLLLDRGASVDAADQVGQVLRLAASSQAAPMQ